MVQWLRQQLVSFCKTIAACSNPNNTLVFKNALVKRVLSMRNYENCTRENLKKKNMFIAIRYVDLHYLAILQGVLYFDCGIASLLCGPPLFMQSRSHFQLYTRALCTSKRLQIDWLYMNFVQACQRFIAVAHWDKALDL